MVRLCFRLTTRLPMKQHFCFLSGRPTQQVSQKVRGAARVTLRTSHTMADVFAGEDCLVWEMGRIQRFSSRNRKLEWTSMYQHLHVEVRRMMSNVRELVHPYQHLTLCIDRQIAILICLSSCANYCSRHNNTSQHDREARFHRTFTGIQFFSKHFSCESSRSSLRPSNE